MTNEYENITLELAQAGTFTWKEHYNDIKTTRELELDEKLQHFQSKIKGGTK